MSSYADSLGQVDKCHSTLIRARPYYPRFVGCSLASTPWNFILSVIPNVGTMVKDMQFTNPLNIVY